MKTQDPGKRPGNSGSGAGLPASAKHKSKSEERMRAMLKNPIGSTFLLLLVVLVIAYPFIDEAIRFRKITTVIPLIVYMLLALGLNIVVGYAGLLDLGYAAFFAIGAYVAGFMTSPLSFLNKDGMHWYSNFWVALIAAFLVSIAAGIILGAPTLRLRGDYLAIVTLGFGEIVPIVFRNATDFTYGERGLSAIQKPTIDLGPIDYTVGGGPVFGLGDWSSQLPWYYLLLIIGVIAILGLRRLQDSRVGRAWMAMREDEIAASAMGINLVTTKLSAFGMGASLSGVAGAVFGSYIGSIFPSQFEFSLSVILLCAVILGGLGNIWGVILGGLIIQSFDRILAPELTNLLKGIGDANNIQFLATIELSNWRYFIFGAALVILMLVRPEGIMPSRRAKAELHPEALPEAIERTPEIEQSRSGFEPLPEELQARQSLYDVRELDESPEEKR